VPQNRTVSGTTLPLFDLDPGSKRRQRDQILRLLIDHKGTWVPLPAILSLNIAQFGARILELRALGFNIQNETFWCEGKKCSRYRLIPGVWTKPPRAERKKRRRSTETLNAAPSVQNSNFVQYETGKLVR
jgi:hypothetical protein